MLRAGRKLKYRQDATHALTLCDTSSISLADAKYYEELRRFYLRQAIGDAAFEEQNRVKALDPTDPKTVELITDLFETASRLN